MIAIDEDALECDLAETYRIYNYRELPLTRVALFASGLKHDSRIMMAMSGMQIDMDTYLLATIADYLSWLVWSKTKDAQKNKNRPESIVAIITGKGEEKEEEMLKFESAEEFEALRQRLLNQAEKGG